MPRNTATTKATTATDSPPVAVVVAAATFHASNRVTVVEGSLWDAAHPIVIAHPRWFIPVEDVCIRAVPDTAA